MTVCTKAVHHQSEGVNCRLQDAGLQDTVMGCRTRIQVAYKYGSFMQLGKVKEDKKFRIFCAYLQKMGTVTCPSLWSTGYVTMDSDILSTSNMPVSVHKSLNRELHCCNFENLDFANFSQISDFQNGFKYLDFAKYPKKY